MIYVTGFFPEHVYDKLSKADVPTTIAQKPELYFLHFALVEAVRGGADDLRF